MVALPGPLPASGSDVSAVSSDVPEAASIVLEITRGRTRFRSRPVTTSRFLIGAGVTCDLRLGGQEIPAIHSILTIEGKEVHLEAINPVPALVVNGTVVRETQLADGDTIVIGDVTLQAHLSANPLPAATPAVVLPTDSLETEERAVSELSAAELVELIETEEQMIDDFDSRRRTGARALTQALRSRAERTAGRAPQEVERKRSVPAPHFLSKRPQVVAPRGRGDGVPEGESAELQKELLQLGEQLALLSQQLTQSSQRASVREAEYASATDVLMETQQKLLNRFETLLTHVQRLQEQKPAPISRAIA
jgi:hypothetical protein